MIRKLLFSLWLLVTPALAGELEAEKIYFALGAVEYDEVVNNICSVKENQDECRILKDKEIGYFLKRNYKNTMFIIAQHESYNFTRKVGIVDKDDITYFQINKRIWNQEEIKRVFNLNIKPAELMRNNYKAAYLATHIWLYNVAHYIVKYRRVPRNIYEYAALYHRPNYICKKYAYAIMKRFEPW